MKNIVSILVAIVATSTAMAVEPYELSNELTAEIKVALTKSNLDRAEQLSRIAANLEAARLNREGTKALKLQARHLQRLDNLVKSAPAFIDGFEKVAGKELRPGSDEWMMLHIIRLVVNAADRPLTSDEVVRGLMLKNKK